MALIACSECGRQVSDKAVACPGCGNPLNPSAMALDRSETPVSVETQPGSVVTTQATGRGPKIVQLVGALIMIVGVISCSASGAEPKVGAAMLMFVGLIVFLAGRFAAWWRHG